MVIDDKWRLLQLKLSQKTLRKTAVCSYPNSFGCKTNQVAKKHIRVTRQAKPFPLSRS